MRLPIYCTSLLCNELVRSTLIVVGIGAQLGRCRPLIRSVASSDADHSSLGLCNPRRVGSASRGRILGQLSLPWRRGPGQGGVAADGAGSASTTVDQSGPAGVVQSVVESPASGGQVKRVWREVPALLAAVHYLSVPSFAYLEQFAVVLPGCRRVSHRGTRWDRVGPASQNGRHAQRERQVRVR